MPTKKVTKKTEKEIANISKFQNNPFAKKYKEEVMGSTNLEGFSNFGDELDNASQVKSWSKYERAIICDNLADIVLAAVVGLIVGVLLTINL